MFVDNEDSDSMDAPCTCEESEHRGLRFIGFEMFVDVFRTDACPMTFQS